MGRYTKPIDLYRAQKKRFEKLALTRKKGFEELERAMLVDAKSLTSGTPTGKERLKILETDRPFARNEDAGVGNANGMRRGGGKGSMPLLPIGILSGRLRTALKMVRLPMGFGLKAPGIDYAKYILGSEALGDKGTSKMVARGFQKAIRSRFKARFKAFLDYYRTEQRKP